jgi:hypothetical protein
MIARVRIAPIEQWCDMLRKASDGHPAQHLLPGREVEIDTQSMRSGAFIPDTCEGRKWKLSNESQDTIDITIHGHTMRTAAWFCEHMLEMD